jgi:hypothetical protein
MTINKHLIHIIQEYYNPNSNFIEELSNRTLNLRYCHDNCSKNDFRNCRIYRRKYWKLYYWVYEAIK